MKATLIFLTALVVASSAFAASSTAVQYEMDRLKETLDRQLNACGRDRACRNKSQERYDKKTSLLQADSDFYFAQQSNRKSKTAIDQYGNVYHLQ